MSNPFEGPQAYLQWLQEKFDQEASAEASAYAAANAAQDALDACLRVPNFDDDPEIQNRISDTQHILDTWIIRLNEARRAQREIARNLAELNRSSGFEAELKRLADALSFDSIQIPLDTGRPN